MARPWAPGVASGGVGGGAWGRLEATNRGRAEGLGLGGLGARALAAAGARDQVGGLRQMPPPTRVAEQTFQED
jgi:hypothetical protein